MVRKNRMNGGAGGIPKDINEILKVEVYNYKEGNSIQKVTYDINKESMYSIRSFENNGKLGIILSVNKRDITTFSFPDKYYEYDTEEKTLKVFRSLTEAEEKENFESQEKDKKVANAIREAAKASTNRVSEYDNIHNGGSSRKSKKSLKKKVASVKPIKTDNKYTDKDGVTRTLYTKDGCKYVKMVVYKKI